MLLSSRSRNAGDCSRWWYVVSGNWCSHELCGHAPVHMAFAGEDGSDSVSTAVTQIAKVDRHWESPQSSGSCGGFWRGSKSRLNL